ncbi:DUF6414 family protein [Actinomadura macra]|uniref:DUF6414 family protein n=1 Tax=Actinomadura macra TaxID=46164 RepID=UPI000A7E1CF2|nr:hypothetical protein [Actinomadura macra]
MANDIVGERDDLVTRSIREFFYVDIQRVRSYYAQMNRGTIESVVARASTSQQDGLPARLLGLEPDTLHQREESRSFQELTYVFFEELFEREGLIADIASMGGTSTDEWQGGRIHQKLHEGQIVKHTGHLRVLDPAFFAGRITNLLDLASAIFGLSLADQVAQPAVPPSRKGGSMKGGQRARSPQEVRTEKIDALVKESMEGLSPEAMRDFAKLADAFTNKTISLRCFPCGADSPQFHFAGALLSRSDYIQDEREELYSRNGTELDGWTIVMQVARIPSKVGELGPPRLDFDLWDGQRIDRVATEELLNNFSLFIEQIGIAEGVTFPSISVTPLAIYRKFA